MDPKAAVWGGLENLGIALRARHLPIASEHPGPSKQGALMRVLGLLAGWFRKPTRSRRFEFRRSTRMPTALVQIWCACKANTRPFAHWHVYPGSRKMPSVAPGIGHSKIDRRRQVGIGLKRGGRFQGDAKPARSILIGAP
jgi:hypothetical protein